MSGHTDTTIGDVSVSSLLFPPMSFIFAGIIVVVVVVVVAVVMLSKHPYTKVSTAQATQATEHAMNKYFGPRCWYPTPPTMLATK